MAEAAAGEPAEERIHGRDEPDVLHFGVATGWEEGVAGWAIDDEGFEDEFAAWAEVALEVEEVVDG